MTHKTFSYDELTELAKRQAYGDWLQLQDVIWDDSTKHDTSRWFFESEYSNDCKYLADGSFVLDAPNKPTPKIKGSLDGIDGNAFAILAYYRKQAERQGLAKDHIQEVINEAKTNTYENLVCVIANQFDD